MLSEAEVRVGANEFDFLLSDRSMFEDSVFFLALLFVLKQKVTKSSRLDLFAKKVKFLPIKSPKLGRKYLVCFD